MAFCIQYNYFEYKIITLNLSNTPVNFERYIKRILPKKT